MTAKSTSSMSTGRTAGQPIVPGAARLHRRQAEHRPPATGDVGPRRAPQRQDLVLICHTVGLQRHVVTGDTDPDGRPALSVVVGAVTVRVRTSDALRCYLHAWTRAAALAQVFDAPAG